MENEGVDNSSHVHDGGTVRARRPSRDFKIFCQPLVSFYYCPHSFSIPSPSRASLFTFGPHP